MPDAIENLISDLIGSSRRELPNELHQIQVDHMFAQIAFMFDPIHDNDLDSAAVFQWLNTTMPFFNFMKSQAKGTPTVVNALGAYMDGVTESMKELHMIGIARVMAVGRQAEWEELIASQKAAWAEAVDNYRREDHAGAPVVPSGEALH